MTSRFSPRIQIPTKHILIYSPSFYAFFFIHITSFTSSHQYSYLMRVNVIQLNHTWEGSSFGETSQIFGNTLFEDQWSRKKITTWSSQSSSRLMYISSYSSLDWRRGLPARDAATNLPLLRYGKAKRRSLDSAAYGRIGWALVATRHKIRMRTEGQPP